MVLANSSPPGLGGAPRKLAFGPAIWGWGPAFALIVWAAGLLILPWWAGVFLWWWPSVLCGAALGLATIGFAQRLARSIAPSSASREGGAAALAALGAVRLHPAASARPAPEPPPPIMHVITRLICGGADENTVISCNAQVQAGHEVWLVYGAGSSPRMLAELLPQVRTVQVPALRREIAPVSDVRALIAVWRLVRAIRPDIVHTHTSKAGTIGRLAGWLAGAPLIVHGVHILPFANVGRTASLVYIAIERALAPLTHAFIDVSESMREGNLAAHVGRPAQHHVVYSGMDCERFRQAKPFNGRELAEILGDEAFDAAAANSPKTVLCAAAFEPRKRHLELLEAFARVVQEAPSAHLLLLGEGPGRANIEAKVASLGLAGHVHLLGHRSDIERWIATADICVLGSEREGLPRVMLQYVMAGKPVVATGLPGLERVIRHGASGYLVSLTDISQMAAPMIELLKDDLRRRRFAAEARAIDLSDWSAERMTCAIEAIYSSALGARVEARA